MTLNEIAENIAYKLGEQFNHTLKESIKHSIIYYRAKFLRDDIDRNDFSYIDYTQSITIPLIKVNMIDEFKKEICCDIFGNAENCLEGLKILRTEIPVPKPIRIKNFGGIGYRFVGNPLRTKSYSFTPMERYKYIKLLSYNNSTYYSIINNYVYILNSLEICDIAFEGAFDNPIEIAELCGNNKFSDDNDFPIATDLLYYIEQGIIKGEYPLINKQDGKQVNIEENDGSSKTNV